MTEQLCLFNPSELECVIEEEAVNAELRSYNKDHCWQYDIRLNNLQEDLRAAHLTPEQAARLTVRDFRFKVLTSEWDKAAAAQFIRRHEWLGNLSQYTTHWFGAYHGNVLAGVLLFNLPNAFSKLLGEDTPNIERLISRGACISWSPKNLASSFIMWSINWMVQNTQYRLFTAYSDPMAKELGTVYQACNFYYLGQTAGANVRYINPYSGKIVSDRFFRQRSAYRRFCKELNIEWQSNWCDSTRMLWENVPDDVEQRLRQRSREVQSNAEPVCVPSKHKYAMVLGVNKTETKALRKVFESMNRTFPYPKVR
jgi:hypothetical protein